MNTRSMTKKINNNANNVDISINNNIKDKFMSEVKDLVNENVDNQNPDYDSLKTRIRAVIKIAKKINKEIADVLPYLNNVSRDRILSIMFLTLNNLRKQAEGSHIKDYIDSERRSLKIRKMSLSVQSHCGKALSKLWELIHNYDVSNVPKYDTIVELHRQKQNKYNLRPRTAIVYTEEDQVDDLSDADYNDELEQKMARMDRIVNYVVNKNVAEKDYEYDSSSDYDPNEDLDDNDDESVHFDDDDYAEESEEDDDDYEDEDEYRQADLEFLDEYFNDPDYVEVSSKKVKKVQCEDDDEEYLPENDEDDDDDYLLDTVSESDYDDDSSSDYDPDDDVKPNALDDHFLLFDDDDYSEESEEDDDDYEDDSADEEDAQFVSDYFNDPDYDPAEDDEEEDELEYDFSFKNKKEKENVELVLEAGIANDDGDDSEDYNPDEDEDDEDDDDEVVKVCMNNKLIKVCKRLYNRATGKVNYKWVNMTEDEYNKKYDADYQENEEI